MMTNRARQIHQLNIALGITGATAAVTGALGFICPAFWIGTVISVVGLVVEGAILKETQDLYDSTESDLNDKKNQLRTVMADIAAVQELKAGLENSKGDFDTITTRLGAFASVWATLRADIQAIEKKLELAHSTGIWSLMHSRLNGAAALYVSLGKALRQYQVSVNPDALKVVATPAAA
ncbi:hypothetical protein K474DRAFT_1667946 [Panus rudis PR-1116 ss-1]|nr:hypothetical protein K474DRAFT_1667946 [Panus rudis PR-1116 ss-1]